MHESFFCVCMLCSHIGRWRRASFSNLWLTVDAQWNMTVEHFQLRCLQTCSHLTGFIMPPKQPCRGFSLHAILLYQEVNAVCRSYVALWGQVVMQKHAGYLSRWSHFCRQYHLLLVAFIPHLLPGLLAALYSMCHIFIDAAVPCLWLLYCSVNPFWCSCTVSICCSSTLFAKSPARVGHQDEPTAKVWFK